MFLAFKMAGVGDKEQQKAILETKMKDLFILRQLKTLFILRKKVLVNLSNFK